MVCIPYEVCEEGSKEEIIETLTAGMMQDALYRLYEYMDDRKCMAKWFMAAKKADFRKIAEQFHIDPVIARIIRNRDIVTEEGIRLFLQGELTDLHDPRQLKDVETAVAILKEKIEQQKKIRIIGDYDVDGICATYILYKGLSVCGARVDAVIPHRMKDGYGINEALVEQALAEKVDTILTCDNGIAAKDVLEEGKRKGLTCIVTDHHEVPYEEVNGDKVYVVPKVDAVVDPKQEDCTYPFPSICGAVVAYKLIQVLLAQCQVSDQLKVQIQRELLEPAGIATVCDIMPLVDENRIIVKKALEYLREPANPGLKALISVNELDSFKLTSYSIGFVLGPCINATGRLDTAQLALELLQAENFEEAVPVASTLKEYNVNRKEMTERGVEEAMALLETGDYEKDRVLVLYLPNVHESLAGIIAGRIREKTGKPTFVLTKGEEGVKGSARSIESYSVYEEITKCSHLFTKYGGHKMAAGLSMEEKNVETFRQLINQNCTLTEEDFEEKILIDVPMPMDYVNHRFVSQLSVLEPFGNGNEKPVFAQKNILFKKASRMGKNQDMARFEVLDEEYRPFTLVMFRGLEKFEAYVDKKFGTGITSQLFSQEGINGEPLIMDIIYYPSLNDFRGRSTIQFLLQDYK